jgi:serine/threonine protein kinase
VKEPEGGRVARYELIAKVGQGANGLVYRAQDPTIRRIVALKLLPAEPLAEVAEGTAAARSAGSFFEREAQAAGALLHPNIVTLYDAGRDGSWYYLAMEFIEGGRTFANEIQRGVSVERAAEVAATVAEALDYAHERGVVHRDIKPANLMILPDDTVKVADFGIARLTSAASTMTSDMIVGTPHYMSPEQIQGGAIDGRSDLFSLGVVLYEALTGRKPFEAPSLAAILNRILSGSIEPARAVNPEVPERLSAIVAKAMARDPAQRYARGRELAADLEAFLREHRGEAVPPPARARLPLRAAVASGVLALLLAAAAGGWFFLGGREPAPAPARVGWVHVTSEEPGVEVYLDGRLLGAAPLTFEAPEGHVDLEFRKDGYLPGQLTVTVEPQTRNEVEIPPLVSRAGR